MIYLIATIVILVAFNAYATYALLKSKLYSKNRVLAQLLLIWLLPLIGSLLVLLVLSESKSSPRGPGPLGEDKVSTMIDLDHIQRH